jgi:hypothetical protein
VVMLVVCPRNPLAIEGRCIPHGIVTPPRNRAAMPSSSRLALRSHRPSRCSTYFGDRPLGKRAFAAALCLLCSGAGGQDMERGRGVPRFPLETTGLRATGLARPWAAMADAGRRAATFGYETGTFEVWVWPFRLVRDVQLSFRLPPDTVIEGSALARQVVIRPEGSTLVYSHPLFTVRRHMLVPLSEPGALVLLEVESVRPIEVVVKLRADLGRGWPATLGGGTWRAHPAERRFLLTQTGVQMYHGAIGSPFAVDLTPAANAHNAPSQFVLRFDPATASTEYIPLVFTGGVTDADSAAAVYQRLLDRAKQYWAEKVEYNRRLQQRVLSIATPDNRLDEAVAWSRIDLDQQLRGSNLVNVMLLSSTGQFERTRSALSLFARWQRADGHVPLQLPTALPPLLAPGGAQIPDDGTALFILACHSYWAATGDDGLVRELWPGIEKATHWLEPRIGREAGIFQASWSAAALEVLPALARVAGNATAGTNAVRAFEKAQRALEDRFWSNTLGLYASGAAPTDTTLFADSTARPEPALAVWPAIALAYGLLDDMRSNRMLREIASTALTTDWGTRVRFGYDRQYDPARPESGAVWTMATGYAALAHYRYHRAWAGFDLLHDLSRLPFDFARGRMPELLSGAFYDVLPPGIPQQFATANIIMLPLVSGLLGLQTDASNRAISIEPHLPADWGEVAVNTIRLGRERLRLVLRRERSHYRVVLRREGRGARLFVRLAPALPLGARVVRIRVNDADAPTQVEQTAHDVHAVAEFHLVSEAEVDIEYSGGIEVLAPSERIEPGDRSRALNVLDFRKDGSDFTILVEGAPSSSYALSLRTGIRVRGVSGADVVAQTSERMQLRIRFDAGVSPFARKEIRIRT